VPPPSVPIPPSLVPVPPEAVERGHGGGGGGNPLGDLEFITELPGDGGLLAYFPASQNFVAMCLQDDHGNDNERASCRRVRTAVPGRARGQGRPIGFLLAWLADSSHASRDSHVAHRGRYPLAQRRELRQAFINRSSDPQIAGLLSRERPLRPGEPEEPDVIT